MKYKVTAIPVKDRVADFYEALSNGTITNQKPDGAEIVASMKRAKMTESGKVEWFETCFCSSPLKHERETVLDCFFTHIETELVEEFGEIEGLPYWQILEESFKA